MKNPTLNLGTHQSSARGFARLGQDALMIGANTFQCFIRNPRGTNARALDEADVSKLRAFLLENHFAPVLVHAPYTLNACSHDPHLRQLSLAMFMEDLARMEYLPGNLYNLHPGSHTGQGVAAAVEQIAEMLNAGMFRGQQTRVLLETMAGKGTEVGRRFEELREVLDRATWSEEIGVCFDACHLYSAGYDIVRDLDGVLETFDRLIGLDRLYAFHLNDSAHPFASHKDRHLPIGEGTIGREAIGRILRHPALRSLVFVTETPLTLSEHAAELRELRQMAVG